MATQKVSLLPEVTTTTSNVTYAIEGGVSKKQSNSTGSAQVVAALGYIPLQRKEYIFNHVGSLPFGTTAYFSTGGLTSTLIPIHLALANETITSLNILTDANGPAHTDTYTVYVNGGATAMIATITNSTAGSSAVPVSLIPGQNVAIEVVTDAATTGGNVLVQLTVERA